MTASRRLNQILFGPVAKGAGQKDGRQAEARRPKEPAMLNITQEDVKTRPGTISSTLFSDANKREVSRIKGWLESRLKAASSLRADDLISEVVTISPAQAEYILQTYNVDNRPIRPARVAHWSETIKKGLFLLTSQGISFSEDGRLNNGQHRLHGCIHAGMPIRVSVTFGEGRDAFAVLDQCGIRTGSDVLQREGLKHYTIAAAIARQVIIWQRLTREGGREATREGTITRAVSNAEILELVRGTRLIEAAATSAAKVASKLKCTSSGVGLGLFLIRRDSRFVEERFATFVEKLALPSELPAKSVIFALRDALQNKTFRSKAPSYASLREGAATVLAWNGFVRGRRANLNWLMTEPFPKPE